MLLKAAYMFYHVTQFSSVQNQWCCDCQCITAASWGEQSAITTERRSRLSSWHLWTYIRHMYTQHIQHIHHISASVAFREVTKWPAAPGSPSSKRTLYTVHVVMGIWRSSKNFWKRMPCLQPQIFRGWRGLEIWDKIWGEKMKLSTSTANHLPQPGFLVQPRVLPRDLPPSTVDPKDLAAGPRTALHCAAQSGHVEVLLGKIDLPQPEAGCLMDDLAYLDISSHNMP